MLNPSTVEDALAILSRTSPPTVLTEGRDDYRVMRKVEQQLSDIGVDFLPLSGKDTVLEVWRRLPAERRGKVLALVDLDDWIYIGIPLDCTGENLFYTVGYSIENDLLMDAELESLLDPAETYNFQRELATVRAHHAEQVCILKSGGDFSVSQHVN